MVRGRAGRRDRIVDALDLEPGGERRRGGRATSPSAPRTGRRASGPCVRAMSAASTMVRVDGPPEPMMMPVIVVGDLVRLRGRRRGSPGPWRRGSRRCRRRGSAWRGDRPPRPASSVGAPCTWQRKPSSAYLSARTMPDFASRRLASTSWVLLPIDETMPIPVTTTRLMEASCALRASSLTPRSGCSGLRAVTLRSAASSLRAEQADLEVLRPIDDRAVGLEPAIGDAEHELRAHDPLDVDAVDRPA